MTASPTTEPDATSWFVREASEAVSLGAATFVDPDRNRNSSYLDLDRVMAALTQARAYAVWVGQLGLHGTFRLEPLWGARTRAEHLTCSPHCNAFWVGCSKTGIDTVTCGLAG